MTLTIILSLTCRVELHITQSREIGDILSAVANIPISKSLLFSLDFLLNQVFNHNHRWKRKLYDRSESGPAIIEAQNEQEC